MAEAPVADALSAADRESLLQALGRMGLALPGEQPQFEPLTGGVSSLIVRADTRRGPLCIKRALAQLKVKAEWLAPVERNTAEVTWMRIAQAIVPAAVPTILGQDAESQSYAMAYLEPAANPVWKNQLRDGVVEVRTAQAVAQALLAIHRATAAQPALAEQLPFNDYFHALRLAPYFLAAAQAQPAVASVLEHLVERTHAARIAMVHGDVSPKNILVGPGGPVLLDAECACYGDPAFDLAFCANHLLLKCVWKPAHAPAYLAAFDVLVATHLAGVQWEEPAGFARRVAELLPALLLARIDGKSPVEYLTAEGERALVRKFALRYLQQPLADPRALRMRFAETIAPSP